MAHAHHKTAADDVPPVGIAPEGQDYKHPWIVSAVVSALAFATGGLILYLTGWWAKIHNWADITFVIYFAILMPVIVGFFFYGIYLLVRKLSGHKRDLKQRW